MARIAIVVLFLLAGLAGGAHAQTVPSTLSFAGRLTDTAGVPLSGAQNLEFALYGVASGGGPVWTEQHLGVDAVEGMLFVELGARTTLDASVFDGARRYLEIRVGGSPLSPRLPIGSVPYAFRAEVAALLGPYGPEDVQARIEDGCAAGSSIRAIGADGSVTCEVAVPGGGGDITGVAAGAGLTGGGSSGDVSLAVDTGVIQRRVAGTCAAGSSIRAITAEGTVTCEVDDVGTGDVTAVTAGPGLTGGGTSGDLTLQVADNGIGLRQLSVPSGSKPSGPSGVIQTNGYLFGSDAFTAPASGRCMVTVTATVDVPQFTAGSWGAVYAGVRVNGSSTAHDGGYGVNIGESVAGRSWASGTASHVFAINAGASYEFGCYLANNGVYVGQTYYCRVAYMCT